MALEAEKDVSAAREAAADTADDGVVDAELSLGVLHESGDVICGRYRLTALLGRGGMGDVWRAYDETLEIEVALKLIRPEDDADDSEDRLLREAQIAARLGHPAIVRISDFGRSELDEPFIVMELLEGADLGTALKARGKIRPIKAVRMILPVVHALSAAHAKGIVHRDVKPDNIFLAKLDDEQFQPKIVDFGIAKFDRSKGNQLTKTGALIGSPTYMSPEQARGETVDARADIWSLCVVLYEMVVGEAPFKGKNSHALLYSIMVADPDPMPTQTAAEASLWAILQRGLEKDADARIQTARDLGVLLADWLLAQGVTEDITGASLDGTWRGRKMESIAPIAGLQPGAGADRDATTQIDDKPGPVDAEPLDTAADASASLVAPGPVEVDLDRELEVLSGSRRRRRNMLLGAAGAAALVVGIWLGAGPAVGQRQEPSAAGATAEAVAAKRPQGGASAGVDEQETTTAAATAAASPPSVASAKVETFSVESLPPAPVESAAPPPAPKPRVYKRRYVAPKQRPAPKPKIKMKDPFQ